jgi:hypothetical protein
MKYLIALFLLLPSTDCLSQSRWLHTYVASMGYADKASIAAFDDSNFVVSFEGRGGAGIFTTEDAGQKWIKVFGRDTGGLVGTDDVAYPAADVIIAAVDTDFAFVENGKFGLGKLGSLIVSNDKGQTWIKHTFGTRENDRSGFDT